MRSMSQRFWIRLLVLAVIVVALAPAQEAEATECALVCSGWQCIEWNNNYCMRLQNCCVCQNTGAWFCDYFDRGYAYIA